MTYRLGRRVALALVALLALASAPACSVPGLGGGGGTYELVAYFPRAVSIFKSSDVRVLGLPAGSVRSVDIEGDRVKLTLAIDDDIPVPRDVAAMLVPRSLIGERYVQLAPAWQEGEPKAADGQEIEDTIVPVEPDEALAALKDFLDSLDPKGLGKLVDNIAEDLGGNGATLNSALENLSGLVSAFASEDDELLSLVDNFDKFTSTLLTREAELGQVLDAFAQATDVLATERGNIERLVAALARVSEDGLDLVAEHATALRRDIEIVTRVARAIDVNLGAVEDLLDSGPALIGNRGTGPERQGGTGLLGAYNDELKAIDLRNSFSPLVLEAIGELFESIGLPLPCIPVDVACTTGLASGDPVAAELAPTTPVDDLLDLLDAPTIPSDGSESIADQVGDAIDGIARSLVGVGG